MQSLPKQDLSYQKLYQYLNTSIKANIMMAGLELDVFSKLKDYKTAGEAADELGAHRMNTQRFLDALVTIDLLEKKRGFYRNLPEAGVFLSADSPTYVGRLFEMVADTCIASPEEIAARVKYGPLDASEEEAFKSDDNWADFARISGSWAYGEVGMFVAGVVSSLEGASGFEKMLDLGGGNGVLSLYILDANPSMKSVVFDQPAVVDVTREFSREYGMEDRVDVIAGNYMEDELGGDYDLVFACSTLNFAKGVIGDLFEKVYDSLKPGGYFITFQDGMTNENTRPDTMLGHLVNTLSIEKDYSFPQGFLADVMAWTGFKSIRSRTVHTPMGPLDMDIARK